jgi:MIP family channel proteins
VQERGPAAYIAEFVGTFFLVFFITAAVSLYVAPPPQFTDFSVIALVHVFVLFGLIQTLAIASGAHFNPAVTAAMVFLRQITPADALIYVVTQFAGAVAGALVTKAILVDEGDAVNYGATIVNEARLGGDILPGMVCEAIGTFFLVWVIIGVAVNPQDWAGLAIGAALGLGVMVFAPLTGAGLNPARSFGPALVGGSDAFNGAKDFILVYTVAPLIGALLAAVAYQYLYVTPGAKEEGGMEPVG